MTPDELLVMAVNNSAVAYHKFVLLCTGRESDLFCFFEAKDAQYYSARIKSVVKRSFHPISCGNKQNVIEAWRLISGLSEYKKYKISYYIDRDFDQLLAQEGVYETSCYSIENYYVREECISEILKSEFGLTEIDEEFNVIMSLYRTEIEKHNNEILLFNGWYAALKYKKYLERLRSTKVGLEDKLPKGFLHLKIGAISSEYDLAKIRAQFPDAIIVADEEVFNMINKLKSTELSCSLRGKYQFTFLYTFLQYLIHDANISQKILKRKTNFNVDKKNMYSQLSQYAYTPKALEDYLRRFN